MIYKGRKETYPGIGKIEYDGRKSKNPLAFRWYNPEEIVSGKKMKGPFAVCNCLLAFILR